MYLHVDDAGGAPLRKKVGSIREAQALYVAERDASGLGASEWGRGEVRDGRGRVLTRISYNGRLELPDGELLLPGAPAGVVFVHGGEPGAHDAATVKWSGQQDAPLPAVGSRIKSHATYFRGCAPFTAGQGTVLGYDVEHGWLYLVVEFDKRKGRLIHVAGVDLLPRAKRSA